MKLDAYLKYDPRWTTTPHLRSRVYLAPTNVPNHQRTVSQTMALAQPDTFEQHRDAPYTGCAGPHRQLA